MKHLVLADVHANLPALEAVLEKESRWDSVIFLGDAVIAGPHPNEVLDTLRELDGVYVMGNHDREALLPPSQTLPAIPHTQWSEHTRQEMTSESRDFLRAFCSPREVRFGGLDVALHHGDFPHGEGNRVWPDSDQIVYRSFSNQFRSKTILFGHCHIQFRREVGGRTFVNPGSVGAPRLQQPVACYAVLEDGEVSLRAAPYDVEALCAAMDRLPLEQGFVEAWKAGFRTGTLPEMYDLRDFGPLVRAGYR